MYTRSLVYTYTYILHSSNLIGKTPLLDPFRPTPSNLTPILAHALTSKSHIPANSASIAPSIHLFLSALNPPPAPGNLISAIAFNCFFVTSSRSTTAKQLRMALVISAFEGWYWPPILLTLMLDASGCVPSAPNNDPGREDAC